MSLVGCVLGLGSFYGFAAGGGNLLTAPWGLLSIPGLVLSRRGLRVDRKRKAPEEWAVTGIVLGIVGTVVLVLYIASSLLLLWGITHGSLGE